MINEQQRAIQAIYLRYAMERFEREIGETPVLRLACMGGEDEHWQLFTMSQSLELGSVPYLVVSHEGTEVHPDWEALS